MSLKATVKCVTRITEMTCDTVSSGPSHGTEITADCAKLSDHVYQSSPAMKLAVLSLVRPPVRLLAVELYQVLQNWITTLCEFVHNIIILLLVFCRFVL